MKKQNLWSSIWGRLLNRPSKDKKPLKKSDTTIHCVKAIVLPEKETIMTDEFIGFTKTKIQIQEVYRGNCKREEVLLIHEPYYEGYYGGKKCMIIHEKYEPLMIGYTYRFSLLEEESSQGEYRMMAYDEEKSTMVSKFSTMDRESKEAMPHKIMMHKGLYHKVS